jgi:hypothetical protein
MTLSIKNNVNEVVLKAKALKQVTPKAIRTAFYEVGKDLVADAKKYIDEPKHGRIYLTRKGQSKFKKSGITSNVLKQSRGHVASAAGEAPAKWTGKLRNSIDFKVTGTEQLNFGVDQNRWGCDYAQYLEYKDLIAMTGNGSKKIAPRPFISRSYKENRTKLINRIQQAFQQSVKNK